MSRGMTVGELIEKFPADWRVVTLGFDECGIDDIEDVEEIKVVFYDNKPGGHCGTHKLVGTETKIEEGEEVQKAVFLDF